MAPGKSMNPRHQQQPQLPENSSTAKTDPPISKNEKKIKQITKKLKAIEDIKDKVALGLEVELTQIEKMKNEEALLKELAELSVHM